MSSPIVYRFRSNPEFHELNFPGSSSVRVFDVKKAIVKQRKLDTGRPMDFDLLIEFANSGEAIYTETARIPRGRKLIVRRVPAEKGRGLLHRMARDVVLDAEQTTNMAHDGYYIIDSAKLLDHDDVLVPTNTKRTKASHRPGEDEELASLKAVIESPVVVGSNRISSSEVFYGNKKSKFTMDKHNADPELRESKPSSRSVIGVPRMFQPSTAGEAIRADTTQFKKLVSRELVSMPGFEGELELTRTSIPGYLACSVCNNLLDNAMCLYWDSLGRSACEGCIRSSVSLHLRCPVSGVQGISPDDLHPNLPLRRAVEAFRKEVSSKAARSRGHHSQLKVPATEKVEQESKNTTTEGDQAKVSPILPLPHVRGAKRKLHQDLVNQSPLRNSGSHNNTVVGWP